MMETFWLRRYCVRIEIEKLRLKDLKDHEGAKIDWIMKEHEGV